MHNMLLSHAKASKLYRDQFQAKQGGAIGIIGNVYMYEPLTDSEHDREAASLALAFNVAWTFDPVVYGDYPREIGRYQGKESPRFTAEERRIMRDSIDFIGINHYGAFYAKACNHSSECACYGPLCTLAVDSSTRGLVTITAERDGVLIGDPTGFPVCYVVPRGMGELVEYIKNRYNNKPIVVTENGYSPPLQEDQVDDLQHDDLKRVQYHKAYVASLAAAMRNGANVRGYFIWTLMDDFEWTSGYDVKFGLYSVDRKTLERTPRASAKWFKDFLRSRNSIHVIKRPSECKE